MAEAKSGSKGFNLEEALRASFRRAGYLVLGGLPYRVEGDDVTDIDLWLYERPVASSRRRLIVDIRNRKSPKAAERIIWTKGLQTALGVDGAMVATTDGRAATRRLARSLGIGLLDPDSIHHLTAKTGGGLLTPLSWTEFNALVKKVDDSRRSRDWREALQEAQGSILSGLGVQSANSSLSTFSYFAQQAVLAQPGSAQAEGASRVAYLMGSLAAVSLDFLLAGHALRPPDDRRAAVINGVRFGQSESAPVLSSVRAAIGLARKYADNGSAVAKQIELGFRNEAEQIPAEIIADFTLRTSDPDALFNVARALEDAATTRLFQSFDALSIEAKSALGAFLDFAGVSREKFANACKGSDLHDVSSNPSAVRGGAKAGPLFEGTGTTQSATDPDAASGEA